MINKATSRATIAALAGGLFLVNASAQAATTTSNLSVTATVTDNCSVSTAPVAFGSVDVLSGTNYDATGTVSVTCTNGTAWSAAAGLGTGTGATFASRKMSSGANLLNYSLYTDAGRTTVWGDGSAGTAAVSNSGTGAAQNFSVYGRVPLGQSAAQTGAYSDTVLVTVTY
ncbi:MAG TPA: spore coat U domain-containing protein [Sphingomicrobium sp.]|nr:spore coat U domain-containing protein [Sphingomicrobium sp.]